MDRLSIKWRLGGGFAIACALILVMAGVTTVMLNRLSTEFSALESRVETYSRITAIQEDLGEARMYAFAWRATGEESRISSVQTNIEEALAEISILRGSDAVAAEEVSALFEMTERYGQSFALLVDGDTTQSATLDAIGPEMLALIEAKYDQVNASVNALKESYAALSSRTLLILMGVCLVGVLACAAIAFTIVRSLSIPLTALIARIGDLADGDYDAPTPHTALRDELGRLAAAQESLRERLKDARQLEDKAKAEGAERIRRAEALETLIAAFEADAERSVDALSEAGDQLRNASRSMAQITNSVDQRASHVAAASEESAANVQTVASSAEELAASIGEILRSAEETATSVSEAAAQSSQAREELQVMVEAVDGMHAMLDSISGVAEQTNLLALNATIEAARAGEAGKGFAVVAEEVKALASQTQTLTEQIGGQIEALRSRSNAVSSGAQQIGTALDGIRGQATATTSTAEQQTAAVREISASAQEAANGAGESSSGVGEISTSVAGAVKEAQQVEDVADRVADMSATLKQRITDFLGAVKAA